MRIGLGWSRGCVFGSVGIGGDIRRRVRERFCTAYCGFCAPGHNGVQGRFQRWVRSGQMEKALRALAEKLHDEGGLDLKEALIDGRFASAKKRASPSGKPSGAGGEDHGPRHSCQSSSGRHRG